MIKKISIIALAFLGLSIVACSGEKADSNQANMAKQNDATQVDTSSAKAS